MLGYRCESSQGFDVSADEQPLVECVVDPPSWAADRASLRRARVLPSEEGKATSTRILSNGRPRAIITSRSDGETSST
jgi:hypothetical protein